MLHLLYILAFTILAFLAVFNLVRNLMMLGAESSRSSGLGNRGGFNSAQRKTPPHPELVDEYGSFIDEPYLVMKSISVEDAREQLDALYEASPGSSSASDKSQDDG